MIKTTGSYFTVPLITLLFLYFASGLPLALTASTLSAWLAEAHVDIATIGLFAFAATPYTLKFLWSPFMDQLPFRLLTQYFGRRRGWILATQIALVLALLLLAFSRPDMNPLATALAALCVSFLSASQDIVIDAYRVEILAPEDQGRGAAVAQLGYRMGMIASTAGALRLATVFGWQHTYIIMAALLGIGIAATLLARKTEEEVASSRWPVASDKEDARVRGGVLYDDPAGEVSRSETGGSVPPIKNNGHPATGNWQRLIIDPFTDFMKHDGWWLILLFVVIYKFADAFIGIVTNPFLLATGFTKDDISYIVKIYGTIATLAGTFAGGVLVVRYGSVRIMFVAGLLHAMTNLLYTLQAHVGANHSVLTVSVIVENVSGGISSAAFVAFLSNLCNRHYTATQYALLSSLAAFGRTWLAAPAGFAARYLGWEWFFALAALLALPGLIMLRILERKRISMDFPYRA